MTDLEITRLCAQAMGYDFVASEKHVRTRATGSLLPYDRYYDPLHDDAQAMALVKKFQLSVYWIADSEGGWSAAWDFGPHVYADNSDINRAICECVAKMQLAKGAPERP